MFLYYIYFIYFQENIIFTIFHIFYFLAVDNVLQRMTIIGVILCFRQLAQEALVDVLEERIPFLLTSILDFCQHLPGGDTSVCII